MKAVQFITYGNPERVLDVREVDKPIPKNHEVLVQIRATAINDYDWSLVRGKPYLYRLLFGLFRPRVQIPGMELAGMVDAVGSDVTRFTVGDAVFGDISEYGFGTFAEYVCVDANALVKKPDNLSFEEATAVPHAFCLALQALRDLGQLTKGQKILINGGGGGVGTLAVQLAKLEDCVVTGVDSGEKLEQMKAIGYDHVIDYKKTNFTKNGDTYDLILDCKSNQYPWSYLRALSPNGIYVTIGGNPAGLINLVLFGKVLSLFSTKKLLILSLKSNRSLDFFLELYDQKKINIIIDGPYLLKDTPRLIQYFGEGKHRGKVVIKGETVSSLSH
ncbi:NAD(P)-dependent alcohol dehydrogenase [Cyclobacterium jeungdonense]|uniref:NAD(P)-dependent alcohol dehydrogenase n=1 Tax=Cyclobacterium jeungdonense TaxID=708087 RepID=A0ABT8C2R3_9BACT|nr:NAD(P)-dependent alcohol dehydrogenase [Cyclobacterium jeungdonense]MDN3687011.1 NAD(P)-dependent alcohol dehydrogenase [Cyclobacterium jeungdonense]